MAGFIYTVVTVIAVDVSDALTAAVTCHDNVIILIYSFVHSFIHSLLLNVGLFA